MSILWDVATVARYLFRTPNGEIVVFNGTLCDIGRSSVCTGTQSCQDSIALQREDAASDENEAYTVSETDLTTGLRPTYIDSVSRTRLLV